MNKEVLDRCDYEKNTDISPTEVTEFLNKKVWWKCSAGHVWETVVYSRAKEFATGCPVCVGVAKDKRPDF